MRPGLGARRQSLLAITKDFGVFSESYDNAAEPVGVNMAGHDTYLLGPKTVMLVLWVIKQDVTKQDPNRRRRLFAAQLMLTPPPITTPTTTCVDSCSRRTTWRSLSQRR